MVPKVGGNFQGEDLRTKSKWISGVIFIKFRRAIEPSECLAAYFQGMFRIKTTADDNSAALKEVIILWSLVRRP